MVTSVNTNINALAAIQSLSEIGNAMTATQSAIESGYMVSQASDNPAVFSIAQGMRANQDALTAVGNSLTSGIAQVQSAANAATSISNTLGTLLQTVTQAASLTDPNAIAAMNTSIKNALANIDAFANASTLNGVNLLNGNTASLNVVNDLAGDTTTVTGQTLTSAQLGLSGLTTSLKSASVTAGSAAIATGDVVSVTSSSGQVYDFEFNDGTGALSSQPNSTTTVVAVNMASTDTNSTLMGKLVSAMNTAGVSAAIDSSGNISVQNVTAASSTGSSVTTTAPGAQSAIDLVNTAITSVDSFISKLGASTVQLQGLSDFTSQLSNSLTTALGSLVDANLSAESAQLASLQTKQQLATQSLSLANQGPSSLLSLFR